MDGISSQYNDRKTTILITGSTGFVCKYLVKKLLETTNANIVLTYRNSKGKYKQNNRLLFVKVDLLNTDSFNEVFIIHKPDIVIHLAAMARVSDGEKNPVTVLRANLIATVKLMELCVFHNVKSMIYTSSNLAQDAVSVVGIGKFLAEQFAVKLQSSNTKLICLRMPNVIDSNGAVTLIFKKLIKDNQDLTITHPEMSRMFVSGERAADMLIYLINNGIGKRVYVSYDKPVKIVDLAKDMIKESGKIIGIKYIGMKPGEKLTEKHFPMSTIDVTKMLGLGMIKNYNFEDKKIESAINMLNTKEAIRNSKGIQMVFNKLLT